MLRPPPGTPPLLWLTATALPPAGTLPAAHAWPFTHPSPLCPILISTCAEEEDEWDETESPQQLEEEEAAAVQQQYCFSTSSHVDLRAWHGPAIDAITGAHPVA